MTRKPASVLVSILIVNYQAYKELTACLDSLYPFLADDVEVIVVDHASEPLAARCLCERFPWIRMIQEVGNPGFAAGVNRAAHMASGRYFLLLNPDCIVDDDVAHTLAAWLDEHPQVAASGSLVRELDGDIQASARRFPNATTGFAGRTSWITRRWPNNPFTRRNLIRPLLGAHSPVEVDWVSGVCVMIRRRAFELVGGMDERFFLYWEDADLCFRFSRAHWATVYDTRAGVTHLNSSQVRVRSLVAFHASALRYYCKHARGLGRLLAPVVLLALAARLLLKLAPSPCKQWVGHSHRSRRRFEARASMFRSARPCGASQKRRDDAGP